MTDENTANDTYLKKMKNSKYEKQIIKMYDFVLEEDGSNLNN